MACDGCNCYFSFWVNSPKNENLKKNEKDACNNWRYHHFTQVTQKSRSYAILFLRYGV